MEAPRVLFVDDDTVILDMVEKFLKRNGYEIEVVDSGLKALERVKDTPFDVVFTDYKMPEYNGLELLAAIKEYRPEIEVIIVTGFGTMESAIEAMKYGSYDYIQKPFKLDHLRLLIDRIIEEKKLKIDYITRKRRTRERYRYGEMIGISLQMQDVYETIDRIRDGSQTVLVQGESGVGKKLAARTLHDGGSRKRRPFLAVNCAAAGDGPADHLESYLAELFEKAGDGTIYLDEITDMGRLLQQRLLALLQGEAAPAPRIVSATRRDLAEAVDGGALAAELADLLSEVQIRIPPLRERKEDIGLLTGHFIHRMFSLQGKAAVSIAPSAMDLLIHYHWPGNVIQLSNVIERAATMGVAGALEVTDLPPELITFGRVSGLSAGSKD